MDDDSQQRRDDKLLSYQSVERSPPPPIASMRPWQVISVAHYLACMALMYASLVFNDPDMPNPPEDKKYSLAVDMISEGVMFPISLLPLFGIKTYCCTLVIFLPIASVLWGGAIAGMMRVFKADRR